jgi:hypothetical protein
MNRLSGIHLLTRWLPTDAETCRAPQQSFHQFVSLLNIFFVGQVCRPVDLRFKRPLNELGQSNSDSSRLGLSLTIDAIIYPKRSLHKENLSYLSNLSTWTANGHEEKISRKDAKPQREEGA